VEVGEKAEGGGEEGEGEEKEESLLLTRGDHRDLEGFEILEDL